LRTINSENIDNGENIQAEGEDEMNQQGEPLENVEGDGEDQPENIDQRDVEEEERQTILDRFEEHLGNARLTPFSKRQRFRKPGKRDQWNLDKACSKINGIIDVTQYHYNDITDVNDVVYAYALTAVETSKLKKSCFVKEKPTKKQTKKKWITRLENQIQDLRKDISKIEQIKAPNPSNKMKRNNDAMKKKYEFATERERNVTAEKLKQKL